MSRNYSTTITPSRERGWHLKLEDGVSSKIYRKFKYTISATLRLTVHRLYELKRGIDDAKGSRGRFFSEYSAKGGQVN